MVNQFPSPREAKEFLVDRIVAEAQREGVSLSDIEREMLYFSESGWTLPDIAGAIDEFVRNYDADTDNERKNSSGGQPTSSLVHLVHRSTPPSHFTTSNSNSITFPRTM